ncbi:MAG TPA: alpha/beta hydrolase [Candidatus Stackebrandtia faecavium]|nr:alpha/beta hydrolase [Candidatus Stackebrandtia faecavium]
MTNPHDVLTRYAPPGITVPYGTGPDQVVEVFAPHRPAHSTIVFFHGGFWRSEYDRSHVRPLCNALASMYAVVSVEYRRTGDGGGWPHTFDDVSAALRQLDEVSTQQEIPRRFVLAGHSAGGHLALWAAARHAESVPIRGVVALAPVADLELCHHADLDDGAAEALLGGSPARFPQRYALTNPMQLDIDVPVTIVHGTSDDRVPIEMSRRYALIHGAHLQQLDDVDHFGLIDPKSAAWPSVTDAMRAMTHR